jgi:hypothetical protein
MLFNILPFLPIFEHHEAFLLVVTTNTDMVGFSNFCATVIYARFCQKVEYHCRILSRIKFYVPSNKNTRGSYAVRATSILSPKHSGRMDSKTIHSTIDTPPGVPGVSKNHIFFSQIKVLSFCPKIAQKRHKLQKWSKLKKKCQKTPVFLDIFEYSSIWGQS